MDSLGALAFVTVAVLALFMLLLLGRFTGRALRTVVWVLLAVGVVYLIFGVIELAT